MNFDVIKKAFSAMVAKLSSYAAIFKPSNLKERGLKYSLVAFASLYLAIITALIFIWDSEPELFDVKQVALNRANDEAQLKLIGYTYTSTLIEIGETLLDKRGGYLSNDITPPGVLLDNIPNWEFGALVVLRDATSSLRNHFSRSQSQSVENIALSKADPQFNFSNDSWILPATESEYRDGIEQLLSFTQQLSEKNANAQFFARADNLVKYLDIVEKRLGSLSQRLSASVGQVRVNTDLAGDSAATQSASTGSNVVVKTPWLEIDDIFYEARGACWALYHVLSAVEHDFDGILRKKNALISLRQILRELESTQETTFSPMVMNGSGFGITANYSLIMANYIARANAAIIDLRSLLENG